MKILADTSLWVDYFRSKNPKFDELLLADQILSHEMVIGELVCGTPPEPRLQTLGLVRNLEPCGIAQPSEVIQVIEQNNLYGQGVGWVDMCLLCSVLITPTAKLWTLDQRLHKLAQRMGVAFTNMLH